MTERAQTTRPPAASRDGIYVFCGRLRLSQRRALAERFGLDMHRDPKESQLERDKGWLSEAKALGRLDEVLDAALGMEKHNG